EDGIRDLYERRERREAEGLPGADLFAVELDDVAFDALGEHGGLGIPRLKEEVLAGQGAELEDDGEYLLVDAEIGNGEECVEGGHGARVYLLVEIEQGVLGADHDAAGRIIELLGHVDGLLVGRSGELVEAEDLGIGYRCEHLFL